MKTTSLKRTSQRVARLLVVSGAIVAAASSSLRAQGNTPAPYRPLQPDQLDSLVAPVALYADPLLAQVMLAATYPQEVDAAAKWVAANGTAAVDAQPWDVSVKAIAHYPAVLNVLDYNLEWTAALGAAYANQSTDVMDAVQQMRAIARANGNLASNPEQQVVTQGGNISVWPAQPRVIYVPQYDPYAVYYDPCLTVFCGPAIWFGVGYPIGSWLIYDWNWPARRIFYTGWEGGGWVGRSRPFVALSGAYVNERFRTVPFNRAALPVQGAAAAVHATVAVRGAPSPFVTRATPQTARAQPATSYRGGPPSAWANVAPRPGGQAFVTRAAPAVSRQAAPSRAAYAAPWSSSPSAARGYAAPRAAPAARPSAPAPRSGGAPSRGSSRASGHGR